MLARWRWFFLSIAVLLAPTFAAFGVHAAATDAERKLARDIFEELVNINTILNVGSTAKAADAMAARLLAAGFPAEDVQVFKPTPEKGNLVARLRGSGERKPMLLVAHLDVVSASAADWGRDPFTLTEREGYFYGRGTVDTKSLAALWVSNLIRLKREGYRPARDIVLVLETDEEWLDSDGYGMQWLLKHQRPLLDAEFALNEGGAPASKDGKPYLNRVQTSEKVATNLSLVVRNVGGHASVPKRDNAIYRLAQGLDRLARFDFPLTLNDTTRGYFAAMAKLESGELATDMRAVAHSPPDAAAAARLSKVPEYNAQLRTTCTATRLEAGHANNALAQMARANLNCRLLPGHSVEQVIATLKQVVADEQIQILPDPTGALESDASPIAPEIFDAIKITTAEFWPGIPVIPTMLAGATDGAYLRNAGIPTYGHTGIMLDFYENRAHGQDERIPVASYYTGLDYLYALIRRLASGR
jgi:acetylornithine deacetylase/succinyl-diaminopimelate desuccinylase-like protein